MYFEFLFRRAPSRRRVAAMYWSGVSFDSLTTSSKDVTVGTTGPIGSGLPQFGLPRRFAISYVSFFLCFEDVTRARKVLRRVSGISSSGHTRTIHSKGFTRQLQDFPCYNLVFSRQFRLPAVHNPI